MPNGYQTCVSPVTLLTPAMQADMARLYLAHYAGSSERLFLHDLAQKQEVVLLLHASALVGFSALLCYTVPWQARTVRVVYSGDTIVAQAHWGQQALAFAVLRRMGALQAQQPAVPLYWLLLTKGQRTYRYLPTFARRFHPHWSAQQPDLRALADHLAQQRFGAAYDASRGVVRFANSHGHLRPDLAEIAPETLNKPAVQFFVQRNPDYHQGDELVCLCPLTISNLKPLAQRLFAQGGSQYEAQGAA